MSCTRCADEFKYHAILCCASWRKRGYTWICREYKGSLVSGEACENHYGYKTHEACRKAADAHMLTSHNGGKVWCSYASSDGEWKKHYVWPVEKCQHDDFERIWGKPFELRTALR